MTTSTDTTAARIAAIEARVADAATPGPWHRFVTAAEYDHVVNIDDTAYVAQMMYSGDAAFIAAAREDVPFLLAELKAARAELERIAACEPAHRNRIRALLAGGEVSE